MLTAMAIGDKAEDARTNFWGKMAQSAAKPFLAALEKEVGERYPDAEVVVSIRRGGGAAEPQIEQPQMVPAHPFQGQTQAHQSSRYDEDRSTFLEQYRQNMEAEPSTSMYGGPTAPAMSNNAQQHRPSYAPTQNATFDQHEPLPGFSGQVATYPQPMETQALGRSKPLAKS